jgi:hypothetical protein
MLLGLDREISDDEDEENISAIEGNPDQSQIKKNPDEWMCYETEEDTILNDDEFNKLQREGVVTPQTPVS